MKLNKNVFFYNEYLLKINCLFVNIFYAPDLYNIII